jgi:hypothetical protein
MAGKMRRNSQFREKENTIRTYGYTYTIFRLETSHASSSEPALR